LPFSPAGEKVAEGRMRVPRATGVTRGFSPLSRVARDLAAASQP
jgi:hypothetical protein